MTTPQKIGPYEVHPAAHLFPMMEEAELQQLAADIKANGQREPIILLGRLLLDGRNRWLACEIAGVEPNVADATLRGGDSPLEYVLGKNIHRRHLTPSQRAAIAADAQLLAEEERARERQREGGRKGGKGSAPGREASDQRVGTSPAADPDRSPDETAPEAAAGSPPASGGAEEEGRQPAPASRGKAAAKVAAIAGVGARSVERAKAVRERAPALFEKVKKGETTLKRAEKNIRRAEQLEQVKAYVPPAGEFPVIATDVPWEYEDGLDGSDAARGGLTYPPMKIEEICALKVPAARDCILWFWVTNTHLINGNAARVLAAWGFTPKTMYTWDKVDIITGRWGRNVTEHVILAVKGNPVGVFDSEPTLFREKRSRVHSKKPEAFYRLVERSCPCAPEARLEMFARQPREGWVTTGAELPAPAARGDAGPKLEGPAHSWERQNPLSAPARALYRCLICDAKHRGQATPPPFGPCRSKELSPARAAQEDAGEILWWLASTSLGVGPLAHAYPGKDVAAYSPEVTTARQALCGVKRPKDERPAGRGDEECPGCKDAALARSVEETAQEERPKEQAPFLAAALNHYRNGLDLCPWCGVDESKNSAEKGGSGWVSQGGLAICGKCSRAGRPLIATVAKDRRAWERATRLPIRERRAKAAKTRPAMPGQPREVKIKPGSYRVNRNSGQCESVSTRPPGNERCQRGAHGVVKATSGRLFSVCVGHGSKAVSDRVLRVAMEG